MIFPLFKTITLFFQPLLFMRKIWTPLFGKIPKTQLPLIWREGVPAMRVFIFSNICCKRKTKMCKVDLKDAYFCVPLHHSHIKYVRFQWEGHLQEFLCWCLGLGLAPRIFTKLLKIPVAILGHNIRIIIYVDDMLLMRQKTIESLKMARDKLIFLFQQLGFVVNVNKSVLSPT